MNRLNIGRTAAIATLLSAAAILTLSGCTRPQSAWRAPLLETPRMHSLVQIREAAPKRPTTLVGMSVVGRKVTADLGAGLSTEERAKFQAEAAAHGADMVIVESLNTPWRKAWYGLSMRYSDAPDPPMARCSGAAFDVGSAAVVRQAGRCLKKLKSTRKALVGHVAARGAIDAFGSVFRLAPGADGSRDSQVRACLDRALYRADFGAPADLTCGFEIAVPIP